MEIGASQMKKTIEEIYKKHKWELEMFGSTPEHYDDNIRNHYIYAWYTKTEPKKYFYIGRGKGKRYNHILKDIEDLKKPRKEKGYHYKILQENLGIDYEFLYQNLTQKEAVILEAYVMLEFLKKKEPLLNIITPCLDEEEELARRKIFKEKDIQKFLDFYRK